jgi:hypothetical protein
MNRICIHYAAESDLMKPKQKNVVFHVLQMRWSETQAVIGNWLAI